MMITKGLVTGPRMSPREPTIPPAGRPADRAGRRVDLPEPLLGAGSLGARPWPVESRSRPARTFLVVPEIVLDWLASMSGSPTSPPPGPPRIPGSPLSGRRRCDRPGPSHPALGRTEEHVSGGQERRSGLPARRCRFVIPNRLTCGISDVAEVTRWASPNGDDRGDRVLRAGHRSRSSTDMRSYPMPTLHATG
jgi:hypothetical protein